MHPRTNFHCGEISSISVFALAGMIAGGWACSDAEGSQADVQFPGPSTGGDHVADATVTAAGGKHALIIAIADYPRESGYSVLNADNDVPLVRAGLKAQGFTDEGIVELRDADATREGILGALDGMVERVQPGDVAVIHYSGHGHRITDQDGDELDGWDEVLVPYGAPMIVDRPADERPDYDGSRHVRDEEFGQKITALRQRVGAAGNVAVFIDACFSGTGTRAPYELPVRGVLDPIGPPAETAGRTSTREGPLADLQTPQTRSGNEAPSGLAPFALITATRADELDHERFGPNDEIVGPLSLAMSEVLPRIGRETTYRAMFDQIKRQMADIRGQTPQLEGDADTRVFNGNAVDQTPYYEIVELAPGEAIDTIFVGGGRVGGLLAGSRVALYPAGTVDPTVAAVEAEGSVAESYETDAMVVLDDRVDPGSISGSWVFVTQPGIGERRLRVFLDPSIAGGMRSELASTLGELTGLSIAEAGADLAVVDSAGYLLLKQASENRTLYNAIPSRAGAAGRLRAGILSYARYLDLQEIELTHADFSAELEVVPVRHARSRGRWTCPGSTLLGQPPRAEGNYLSFRDGDHYLFRVHNRGESDAYVTVIELWPDGTIQQLVPRTGNSPEQIPAGTSRLLRNDCFIFTPPLGLYMLKLLATNGPIDLRPVLEGQGTRRGDRPPTPLERMLAESFRGVRGGEAVQGTLATGDTDALMVRIEAALEDEGSDR